MELINVSLRQLDKMRHQRYSDGTGINYLVSKSPFRQNQYGVHLELVDSDGKVYQKIEVYFKPDQLISEPFEANGGQYRLTLVR
ncbi:hypothetical protein IWT140_02239 [Secundilactobacillus pentosiphilus]|uniref:Uncharacterized protein n=1 Tax=Secundilactobacillus pentosiphilus TaxID=1714682 RepID=A0A1Z5IS47_9LACO|nr:hypothetical protein [Secundilactobacillus pentosiphilus]GAX04597.1 hypothetical protein IWT140_02239 [Secundilactobacillus pentosiphilus]GAX06653.1 hypothetical protein IWT25_01998 [Secundilactobacillus pentosiphilus]